MTVSSTTNKSGPYLGNGSTVDFDYEFRILDPSHLTVVMTEDGVDTTVAPSDYTVSGVGASVGGALTFLVAPVTGQSITIIRNAPFTQSTDLENQGAYYAETVEAALDLGVMRDQQLAEGLSRAVQIPVGADAGALAGLIEDIVRLGDSADEIDTVAGIAAQVSTVAGISANVTTVAGIATNVTTVAGIALDVSAVAAIAADVSAVADIAADVSEVSGIAVAVSTVAANDAGVTTVATNIAAVNTAATNIAAIIAAPAAADAAEASADAAAASAASINLPAPVASTFLQRNAGNTAYETKAAVEVRDALDTAPYVSTRAALKALDTTKDTTALLTETGRDGVFIWRAGNYSAQITADTLEGVYVKADAVAATSGAWVRVVAGALNVKWFGATGGGVADDTAAIEAAISVAGVGGTVYFPKGTYIFSDINSDGFGLIQLSGQTWYGEVASSILRLAATTTTINVAVVAADFATDVTIRDMQIDGNRGNITPTSDLYNTFNLVRGPRGGKRMKWQNLILSNSWGRSLQTSNESATEYASDAVIDNVSVINGGTKGISVTKTKKATVSNCFSEINPYTAADHPGGVGDGNAASGSCFEMNQTGDVTWTGNHGVQIGSTVIGPGFRIVNGNYNIQITGNTIEAASYFLFAQNCNDVDFYGNAARSIRGNSILIADADGEAANITCRRVRVHHNTVYDCTGAFVLVKADKSSGPPFVECFIYDNDFVDNAGVATHGIYNFGVVAPASSGTCLVYAWDNNIVGAGVSAAPFAGPAAHEIQDTPNKRWRILAQSPAPISLTGTTSETTMASVVIPKNRIGKNGMLRVTAAFSYPNNANNKITRVRFGGLQVHASTNTTTLQQRIQVEIGNRNALASQFTALAGSNIGFGTSTGAPNYMTIDTTADQPIAITGQLGNASDTLILESYTVELCYGL